MINSDDFRLHFHESLQVFFAFEDHAGDVFVLMPLAGFSAVSFMASSWPSSRREMPSKSPHAQEGIPCLLTPLIEP
jgi:hypothetical protein